MNMKKRIDLIQLLTEELVSTARTYEKAYGKCQYLPPTINNGVTAMETREAIKRRITVLREELMELSRTL